MVCFGFQNVGDYGGGVGVVCDMNEYDFCGIFQLFRDFIDCINKGVCGVQCGLGIVVIVESEQRFVQRDQCIVCIRCGVYNVDNGYVGVDYGLCFDVILDMFDIYDLCYVGFYFYSG